MISMQTRAHVRADGRLSVQLPVEYRETNVSITISIEPVEAAGSEGQEERDANGGPVGFFEQATGAWQGEPLARGEQADGKEQQ